MYGAKNLCIKEYFEGIKLSKTIPDRIGGFAICLAKIDIFVLGIFARLRAIL